MKINPAKKKFIPVDEQLTQLSVALPEAGYPHELPRRRTAARRVKNRQIKEQSKGKQRAKDLLLACAAMAVLALLLLRIFLPLEKVEGYSMIPTLRNGEQVLVNTQAKVEAFDLVCLKNPRTKSKTVLRVIGLPNQKIVYKEDRLFVDDIEQTEVYLQGKTQGVTSQEGLFTNDFSTLSLTGTTKIPKDMYLVLGDNRPYASDSRYFGLLSKDDIIGVVKMRLFPVHKLQLF